MAIATADPALSPVESTLRERIVDTARRVAHLSHDARMLKSVATDAVNDGIYEARRAVKCVERDLADVRDEAAYRVKREPLKAVGVAVGFGVCVGVAFGVLAWFAARGVRRPQE
jgi:ElaB/YqjD/DUF883 family membrane-anchored ribosome-binding protein